MANEQTEQRRLAAIMFTDVVGYSALAQRDEALALKLLDSHRELLRPIFAKHRGREVKGTGDGFLVEFSSALRATRCAVEIQKAMVLRNSLEPPQQRLQLRIGLHLSDVEVRDGDLFGDGVNIASRVESLADAGGICVTRAVSDEIRNKIGLRLERVPRPRMKNIKDPIEVYRVVLPSTKGLPTRRHWWRLSIAVASVAVLVGAAVHLSGLQLVRLLHVDFLKSSGGLRQPAEVKPTPHEVQMPRERRTISLPKHSG